MADQRRRELPRDGARRSRGAGGLGPALPLLLTLALGCSGAPTGPVNDRILDNSGTAGTPAPSPLVGTWQVTVIIETDTDLQTTTTTWRFDPDGRCRQTVETESLAEGIPRTTIRDCTYRSGAFDVTVTFDGGGTVTFEYSFAGFSRDLLVLDGIEYRRLA